MKRILLLFPVLLCLSIITRAQIVDITNVPSSSANAPFGTLGYHGSEYIYSNTEIGTSSFTTAATAINKVGFSVTTMGINTTFSSVSIYMKNIPSTTMAFGNGVHDALATYTLVYTGSMTFPAVGFTEVALTTPFVRTAGSNLQVLLIRNDNTAHTTYAFTSAVGIDGVTTTNSSRRYNSSVTAFSASSIQAASTFRAAIRLKHENPNDASVTNIYTLGKLPIPNAETQAISANITNVGSGTLTNLPVTLDISGANSYNVTETVASLAPGASTIVTFPSAFFFNAGVNNVSVSVPADDNTSNDVSTLSQTVNANTWSYAYGPTPAGGVGFNGGTGDFVAKFNTNAPTFITQVSVNFSVGGQPFKIGIWDATGAGGVPGALVWESTTQNSTAGVFVMPVTPAVALGVGNFYVGVRQTGTANVSFSYQAETPIRPQTFYYASPTGSTTWNDFAPNSPFRFMIEPKLILGTDASIAAVTVNNGGTASCASGSQSVNVTISNPGANAIAPGDATVYLNIGGANTYSGSAVNTTTIGSGATEVVTFPNLPLTVTGTNNDTAYVVVAGDQEPENDTMKIVHQLISSITSLPSIESFETTPYIVGNVLQLAGTGQWAVQTGAYDNAGLTDSLRPHSGQSFAFFDPWTFAAGTSSRLFSTCFDVPVAPPGLCNRTELGFWMTHDASYPNDADTVYVTISTDGGASWTRLQPPYIRYDALALFPTWKKEIVDLTPYAGQSIRIGFDAISEFGNSFGLDDIMVASQAVQNIDLADAASNNIPLSNACEDAGWTYYNNPLFPNEYLVAINWDPNNTGANTVAKAAAQPTINVDAAHYSNESPSTQEAAYTMRRYWNVDIGANTLTEPVNLRFFYDSTEINALYTAANSFITTNGGALKTGTWFKTHSSAFAPNNTFVTPQGVAFAIALANSNINNSRINGIPYAQFDGITSFSGGTFTMGVGLGSPLEPSFLDIAAQNAGSQNKIIWTLPGAYDASHFMVERSTDGSEFHAIEKVNSNGVHTTTNQSYTAYDKAPSAINYYRIKVVEKDGKFSYSKVVSVKNGQTSPISVFPNPAKDQVNISINSAAETAATIIITDVTGKTMVDMTQALVAGPNKITVALNGFAKGTYMIKMVADNKTYVVQFNVQ